jgi:hypothetical protein
VRARGRRRIVFSIVCSQQRSLALLVLKWMKWGDEISTRKFDLGVFTQPRPNVWSGRALQVDFAKLAVSGLASMYPAFDWSVVLLAIMDFSARASSLSDRPRSGQLGHQCSHAPGRPNLHLVSSSRRPRRVRCIDLAKSSRTPHFACSLRPWGGIKIKLIEQRPRQPF